MFENVKKKFIYIEEGGAVDVNAFCKSHLKVRQSNVFKTYRHVISLCHHIYIISLFHHIISHFHFFVIISRLISITITMCIVIILPSFYQKLYFPHIIDIFIFIIKDNLPCLGLTSVLPFLLQRESQTFDLSSATWMNDVDDDDGMMMMAV